MLLGALGVQVVVLEHLAIHLQLLHHEDDAVEARLWRALLPTVVDTRLDLCQRLLGVESWIDVELAVEEPVTDAVRGV